MGSVTRRGFLGMIPATVAAGGLLSAAGATPKGTPARRPVIDITDLYHPPQDPGDNFDLIAAYALPEVDLRGVILDTTQRYRRPYVNEADHSYDDPAGHRDPGFIPVQQLNAVFGRNVPCAVGPFQPMKSPDDRMEDAPGFQQQGVELMLRLLLESPEPVDIVSFGSARPLAVAYNRQPKLMLEKTRLVHLCAGAAPRGFLEWNVKLDVHAFVRVMRSDLPLAVYPCGTEKDAWGLGEYNTYYKLENLEVVRRLPPALQRYLAYAFERSSRVDFIAALEDAVTPEVIDRIAAKPHSVWETAVWMQVAGRKLVRRPDGTHRLLPAKDAAGGDTVLVNELRPGTFKVDDDGQFDFTPGESKTGKWIYHRPDPVENQRAMREALPALYLEFTTDPAWP